MTTNRRAISSGEEIARLGPGDTVGESAIVGHKLRNASVVSVTELEVLHFTSEAVRELIGEVPTFREALEQTTRDRLTTTPRPESADDMDDGPDGTHGGGRASAEKDQPSGDADADSVAEDPRLTLSDEAYAAVEAMVLGQRPHLTRPDVLEATGASRERAHALWLSLGSRRPPTTTRCCSPTTTSTRCGRSPSSSTPASSTPRPSSP